MSLLMWQRWIIAHRAKRDASGSYGEYMKRIQEKEKVELLSPYMESLADYYTRDCKRIIERKKSVYRLYAKITKIYETLANSIRVEVNQIEQKQEQIKEVEKGKEKCEDLLKKLKKDWNEANQTGIIKPEMGAATLGALRRKIDETHGQIMELETEKEKLESDIKFLEDEKTKKIALKSKQFYKCLNTFRYKISIIYGKIERIENKYEKRLNYYWDTLAKWSECKTIVSRTLIEVCKLREVQIFTQDDLFQKERETINTVMKKLIHFEIDV